jgi:hypothetical protein
MPGMTQRNAQTRRIDPPGQRGALALAVPQRVLRRQHPVQLVGTLTHLEHFGPGQRTVAYPPSERVMPG